MRFFFLFLLVQAICMLAFAQEEAPPVQHFFNIGGGYAAPSSYDRSFSSLVYQGHAASVATQYHRRTDKQLNHLDLRFDIGELSNETSFATVNYYRVDGNFTYEKKLKSIWDNRIDWYAGGSFNAIWTLFQYEDFSNNSFNNSVYASLSPHTSLTYEFKLFRRDFMLIGSAYLPVLTLAMRPAYGSSNFFGFLDDQRDDTFRQLLESSTLTSLHQFFRYSNTFALEYKLKKNPNRLRLAYEWNYMRYSEPRLSQTASHNIIFSTMFNF